MERQVVIVGCARTPIGSFSGTLKDFKAYSLGAMAIREAINRSGIQDNLIDEVIMGNILQTEARGNPAREAVLEAGLPIEIPAFTVNKNCASGLRSVLLAATLIKYGEADVIVAGGMESMSRAPYVLRNAREGYRMGHSQFEDFLLSGLEGMGLTAERLAKKYNISRQEQDEFAYNSQMKAAKALKEGLFNDEIFPIQIPQKKGNPIIFNKDEGIRPGTTLDNLAKLRPSFEKSGTVTAGNSSTINDAAAALVLMAESKAKELGLKPLAKIKAWSYVGCDPSIMGIGPVPATNIIMEKTGMSIDDFDLIELNEAFAAQSLACIRELNPDKGKINVNGGAIALGHPVGATGSILVTKLVYMMKNRKVSNGLITLCVGGGQGIATLIENM